MKKLLLAGLCFMFLFPMISAVMPMPGTIWTTDYTCGESQQNVNHFSPREDVYIHGINFDAGIHEWGIEGLPGEASCDPGIVVANGTFDVFNSIGIVNLNNTFCFKVYTVEDDDCGEYKVTFDGKHDNFNVDGDLPEPPPVIPEFGLFAGMLTIVSAITIFFIVRRK